MTAQELHDRFVELAASSDQQQLSQIPGFLSQIRGVTAICSQKKKMIFATVEFRDALAVFKHFSSERVV